MQMIGYCFISANAVPMHTRNPRPFPRLPQNRSSIIILASDVSIHLDSVNDACFPVSHYVFAALLEQTASRFLE